MHLKHTHFQGQKRKKKFSFPLLKQKEQVHNLYNAKEWHPSQKFQLLWKSGSLTWYRNLYHRTSWLHWPAIALTRISADYINECLIPTLWLLHVLLWVTKVVLWETKNSITGFSRKGALLNVSVGFHLCFYIEWEHLCNWKQHSLFLGFLSL